MKDTYLTRPNSYLMDTFLRCDCISRKTAAEVLGVSYEYLCNKFHRDSFTAEDFFRIFYWYEATSLGNNDLSWIIEVYDKAKELKKEQEKTK